MVRHCRNFLKKNRHTRARYQFHESPHFNLSAWGQMVSFPQSDMAVKATVSHHFSISLKTKIQRVTSNMWHSWNIPFGSCHIADSYLTWAPELIRFVVQKFQIIPSPKTFLFFNQCQNSPELKCHLGGRNCHWELPFRCTISVHMSWGAWSSAGMCPQHSKDVRHREVLPRVINCGGDGPHVSKGKVTPGWHVLWSLD